MKQRINVTLPEEMIDMLKYTCTRTNTNVSQLVASVIAKSPLKIAYDKMKLLERSRCTCECCGKQFEDIDYENDFDGVHILYTTPLECGGEDVLSNKKVACDECACKDYFTQAGFNVDVKIDRMTNEAEVNAIPKNEVTWLKNMMEVLRNKVIELEDYIDDVEERVNKKNPAYTFGVIQYLIDHSKYGILPYSQYMSTDVEEEFGGEPLFYDDSTKDLKLIDNYTTGCDSSNIINYFDETYGDFEDLGFKIYVRENKSDDGNDVSGAYLDIFVVDSDFNFYIEDGRCCTDR